MDTSELGSVGADVGSLALVDEDEGTTVAELDGSELEPLALEVVAVELTSMLDPVC